MMKDLVLPTSYEEIRKILGGGESLNTKLMQFVHPVEKTERTIIELIHLMGRTGRVAFLLGVPGIGKSTFIQSLSWRKHMRIREIISFDASMCSPSMALSKMLDMIRSIGPRANELSDVGVTVVVVDYLENLKGQTEDDVRAFFRTLNGLLRQYQTLILWPVTDVDDANSMLEYAAGVSGTVFCNNREIIAFAGPAQDEYVEIATKTIGVLNDGALLEDFGITRLALEEVLAQVQAQAKAGCTLRTYYDAVHNHWMTVNDQLERIAKQVPRPTEIWFVFSYPEAEDVVSSFTRKSAVTADAWRPSYDRLSEYLHDNQRSADWNPKRLQFAIGGAFVTRILFLPTNALVAVLAAYQDAPIDGLSFRDLGVPASWFSRGGAKRMFERTPVIRQLRVEAAKLGKRRSGPGAEALSPARPAYSAVSQWVSGRGEGSDKPLNRAIALAIADVLGLSSELVVPEQNHPWLPSIVPDVRVDFSERYICIEMNYTSRKEPFVIADYVLKKLDRYMAQLERLVGI